MSVAKELGVKLFEPGGRARQNHSSGKQLKLPTLAKFAEFIAEMRRAHSRDSKNCADLTEGLAYTGMRKGEASQVTRGDVNFMTAEIRVLGDPEDGTKNGEVRYVPLIPQARALFARMLAERPDEDDTAKLFKDEIP